MANFDFGKRLNQFIDEILIQGNAKRDEHDLADGQKVFLHAIRRELVKYTDPSRLGYPHNVLEQMESFARTLGDLHNSYFDMGYHKIADCLYNRWGQVFEETKRLEFSSEAKLPCWVDVIEVEKTDMAAFFDA